MKRRRRHNTRRYMHYSPKLSKRLVRAAKIRYRKARLQWLRHAKKHYPGMIRARSHNRRPVKTPYKWFVKYYGVKEGAKYYREAQRKHK